MLTLFIVSVLIFLTPFTYILLSWKPKKKKKFSAEVNRLLSSDELINSYKI